MALALALLVSGWMPGPRGLENWQPLGEVSWSGNEQTVQHYSYQVKGRRWSGTFARLEFAKSHPGQSVSGRGVFYDPAHPEDSLAEPAYVARLRTDQEARQARNQRRLLAGLLTVVLLTFGWWGQRGTTDPSRPSASLG